jgi:hypothetical protein
MLVHSTLALILFTVATSSGATLSEEAIYYRCYGQMARGRPGPDDPGLAAIRAGQSGGVDACMGLLALATLNAQGTIAVSPVAQAVLKTFQDFHGLWFPANDFNELPYDDPNYDIYDVGEAALHVTHALFAPGASYSEVVTAQRTFEAQRVSEITPEFLIYNTTSNRASGTPQPRYDSGVFSSGDGTAWTPTRVQFGRLVGVSEIPKRRDVISHLSRGRPADLDIHQPLGGGLTGTISYLLFNLGRFEGEHADGGLIMPRRWSKAVMKDLLCRDLPVLRATDAIPLVEPQATLPFRASHTCMQCHGTMDGLAGLIRNVELVRNMPGPVASIFATKHIVQNVPLLPEAAMSSEFAQMPPRGRLFFRNLDGEVIDRDFVGLQPFGEFLAGQVDLYACAAKRYYAFFTGIDVSLHDLGDPAHTALSAPDLKQRQQVMDLAQDLQKDQSLTNLVRRIVSLPIYRDVGYQVAE